MSIFGVVLSARSCPSIPWRRHCSIWSSGPGPPTRLEKVRQEWDAQAERARKHLEAEQRWQEAMPASLRPFWEAMNEGLFGHQDLAPLQAALAREFPEPRTRILALLEWYGSGEGPWSGFPSYERTAESLLLAYPTPDLLSAVDAGHLSTNQTEGAARLFAGWTFRRVRPGDGALLDTPLRQRLLEHSLTSDDEDKRARARAAYQGR